MLSDKHEHTLTCDLVSPLRLLVAVLLTVMGATEDLRMPALRSASGSVLVVIEGRGAPTHLLDKIGVCWVVLQNLTHLILASAYASLALNCIPCNLDL